jgi:hypothetical protein
MNVTRSVAFRGRPVRHGAKLAQVPRPEPAPRPAMPPAVDQARNLAGAAGRVVAGMFKRERVTRTPEEADAIRTTHCDPCRHFDKPAGRCSLCGCFAKWKTRLATEHCPVGLW